MVSQVREKMQRSFARSRGKKYLHMSQLQRRNPREMQVCAGSLVWGAPYAILVASHVETFSLSSTFFAVIGNVYCTLFLYCLCIWSAGESVLSETHMKQIMFQCLHSHLGAVLVLYMHLKDARSAFIMTQLLLSQSYIQLMEFLDRVIFRGISVARLKASFTLGTLLVVAWSYSLSSSFDSLARVQIAEIPTRMADLKCLAVAFVTPTFLLNLCMFLTTLNH